MELGARMLGKFARIAVAALITVHAAGAADVAVIVNTGSTNAPGFRIVIERSGNAEFTAGPPRPNRSPNEKPKQTQRKLPDALAERLYSDLDAAKPLSSLPNQRCAKSVSFGTKLTIEIGGQETPDLSCGPGDNARLQALVRDANEIVKLFTPN
jgi:hypothetical protein